MQPSWDDYFITIAEAVSRRATCNHKKLGAVIVDTDHRIVGTGYNGSPPGMPHCVDEGCIEDENGGCIRTIHAETNAILHSELRRVKDSTLYIYGYSPCLSCAKAVVTVGITRVVYTETVPPRHAAGLEYLNRVPTITVVKFNL